MNFALGLLGFLPDAIVVSPYLQNATPSSIVVAWETEQQHQVRCGILNRRRPHRSAGGTSDHC